MPMSTHRPHALRFSLSTGVTLAADAYGDPSAQPVLFFHGGGQTRHAWRGSAAAVAAVGFYAITFDHRGHGESDWAPDGDYHLEAFAADLRAIVGQLDRPPFLVGASLGGSAAMMAEGLAEAPISRGLVLVDVTPRLEIEGVLRILGFMGARPEGFASLDEAADVIAEYLPHRARPTDLRGLAKNLRRGEDGRFRWHWDPRLMDAWSPARFDPAVATAMVAERLAAASKLRVPVLLVRGRMSDVVSEAGAQEFLAHVPHAGYVDLAAGHMVAGDRNDAFTSAVLDFLEKHR